MSQTASATTAIPCPRCKQPLVDPGGLGWCKSCGYCRSLAEGEAKTAAPAMTEPNALTVTGGALLDTPIWLWISILGVALIAVGTIVAERQFAFTNLQRALFCTLQIVIGVALMLIGQFVGLMRVAPEDPSVSFKDAIFPFRLYGLIVKRLPTTQYSVYLGVWGLTAVVTAAIVVGGLGHWFTYLPNKTRSYEVVKLPKG